VSARGERGFALLVVLWSLVLIGLLTTQILASGRTAMGLAGNLRDAAEARARADGAINVAIFHLLLSGANQWPADGSTHTLGTGALTLTVRIDSLAGKINPNLASTALLTGLFQATGATTAQARQMAAGIIGWRSPAATKADTQALLAAYKRANLPYGPPGRPFADLSDLANVIGMTPSALANALPYMSLYQSGDPDPAQAGAVVRRALALSGQTGAGGYEGNFPVVSITAEAAGPRNLAVYRTAIVSIAGGNATVPFQILALTDGDGAASP
jgi:general secretion pathway protein K